MHLGDVVRRNATHEAGRVGVVFGALRQTWQDVDARANRLANALASLGLLPGDRVAVLSRNSHRYLETYFAVAKAGLVTVPLNYRLVGRELAYIYVVDRSKDMIITRGMNVYSSEVEEVLHQHPALAEVAVIGVPDEQWGKSVKAIVALRPGEQADADTLFGHCRAHLGASKVPRTIDFMTALPKSDRGKILKHDLRERYWTGRESRDI